MRSDSLISVSFDWYSPVTGMQVGWICVKQGLANAAPALVGAPDRRGVGALRVGGEIEDVAVAARAEHHRVGQVRLDLAGDQVARHDAARRPSMTTRSSISVRGIHRHLPARDLPLQRLVGAEQQLLAGLAAGVERARDLRAAERAVGEQPAVLARERHALRHALVDDVDADLREPVDVGLARAEVAALDRVVEQAIDAVAVVLVVLGRVDAALRGDAVRAPRRILEAEALDVVAELAQRRGRGRRRPGRCPRR